MCVASYMIKVRNMLKVFLNYIYVSYIHHFTNWNYNFECYCHYPPWYLRYTHNNKKVCAPLAWSPWTFTSTVSKEMNNLPQLPQILIGNWDVACYSCGWFHPTTDLSSGGWIRVGADSILRLTWVSAAGFEFRLILSYGWLEFQRLHKSRSWFSPAAESSSSGWKQVVAHFITWLTRVPADG